MDRKPNRHTDDEWRGALLRAFKFAFEDPERREGQKRTWLALQRAIRMDGSLPDGTTSVVTLRIVEEAGVGTAYLEVMYSEAIAAENKKGAVGPMLYERAELPEIWDWFEAKRAEYETGN